MPNLLATNLMLAIPSPHRENEIAQVYYDPVYISSDTTFAYLGFPGSGTEEDPYIIENRQVTGYDPCVYIRGTTSHFIIRDSIFEAPEAHEDGIERVAIILSSVSNGKIEHCTIKGGNLGIYILRSDNISIHNCSMLEMGEVAIYQVEGVDCSYIDNTFDRGGIYLSEVFPTGSDLVIDNCTIGGKEVEYIHNSQDITISGNAYSQIILSLCRNVTVDSFVSSDTTCAVSLINCSSCSVLDSNLSSLNICSILSTSSQNLTISDNTLEGEGIRIEGDREAHWIHEIENNTIDGLEIQYLCSEADIELTGHNLGQVICMNSTNILLSDITIESISTAITAMYTSNLTLANVSIITGTRVVSTYFYESERITIHDCTFTSALWFDSVNDSTIERCDISSFNYGCVLENSSFFVCNNSTIAGYIIGILVLSLSNGMIAYNEFTDQGIAVDYAIQTEISYNVFNDCVYPITVTGQSIQLISNEFVGTTTGIRATDCWILEIREMDFEYIDLGFQGINLEELLMQDCEFQSCDMSLSLIDCYEVAISDCNIDDTLNSGMIFTNCSQVDISNCTSVGCTASGISYSHVSYSLINNCTLSDCGSGIQLVGCNDIDVNQCRISENEGNGITVTHCTVCEFVDCNFTFNGNDGIEMSDTVECLVVANRFENNSHHGIEILGASSGNEIYYNYFINNVLGNAYDRSGGNFWDDQDEIGNYWDDWDGQGYYIIPGADDAIDHYPIHHTTENGDFLTTFGPTILALAVVGISIVLFVVLQKRKSK